MKTHQQYNFNKIGEEITKSGKNLISVFNLYIAALVISFITAYLLFAPSSFIFLIISAIVLFVISIAIIFSIYSAGISLISAGDMISTIKEFELTNVDTEKKKENINLDENEIKQNPKKQKYESINSDFIFDEVLMANNKKLLVLLKKFDKVSIIEAENICKDLNSKSNFELLIPNMVQLELIFENKKTLPNITNSIYWSSEKVNDYYSKALSMFNAETFQIANSTKNDLILISQK